MSSRTGVYPHEYMDHWEILNETSLPEKQDFFSHSKVKYTTDADSAHADRFIKILK